MPELTQFDSVKSMMRYFPAKGTAGLARWADSTLSRSPCPPARMTAATFRIAMSQKCNPSVGLQNFEQHRVDVPEEPPQVGHKGLPRHWPIGNHVREDRKLGVALNDAGGRLSDQRATFAERNEAVVAVMHYVKARRQLVED